MSAGEKFVQMFIAIGLFFGVVAVILLLISIAFTATFIFVLHWRDKADA